MLEQFIYTPSSPLRQLFRRIPYKWQLKLILSVWEGQYRLRRRSWQWAGSYLSETWPNLGIGQPGLVSVVLPIYNQANTLAQSIDSVLQQSYPYLELIIVNDGSTDETPRILERYAHDHHLTIINQPHRGLPTALNRGFQEARGEFFTWTSGDNLMHSEQVERLLNHLQANPDVALVYADFELINDEGQSIQDAEAIFMRGQTDTPIVRPKREPERLNVGFECVVGPCFMYRSFLRLLIGTYNPKLMGAEDYDYWIRINNFFKIRHLGDHQPLYRYRVHRRRLSTYLKPQIGQLRGWLMKREQKFQQRLASSLMVAIDKTSTDLLSNLQPDQRALPLLNFTLFSPELLRSNTAFAATLLHVSSIETNLISQIKQSGRPLICWLTSNDPLPANLNEFIAHIDLILTLGDRILDADNILLASTPEDIYHMLRIFIATRIDLSIDWPT